MVFKLREIEYRRSSLAQGRLVLHGSDGHHRSGMLGERAVTNVDFMDSQADNG
jgi:hypothetical protein